MTEFFKRFLTEEGTRLNPATSRHLALGAFGKHPGWDDHIEDLGLETESLVLAKTLLYVRGVGGQIDTGAWEKLEPANRLESFDHTFLWQRSGEFLLGRMWSSTDGKGRSRYPMVICAHCKGASPAWGIESILPKLQQLEQACKLTTQAADVRSLLEQSRSELRAALAGSPAETAASTPSTDALRRFVAEPALGPDQQGWFRLLYYLQNQGAAFTAGRFNPRGDLSGLRSQQMRVPLAAPSPPEALLLWLWLLGSRLDRAVPAFLAVSPATQWVDIVLGEPSSHDFFGLRARPAALPLVTEVPYELSESFKTEVRALLSQLQNGKEGFVLGRPEPATEPTNESSSWLSVTQRWFKGRTSKLWLVLCFFLVAGGFLLLMKPGRKPEARIASDTRNTPPAAKPDSLALAEPSAPAAPKVDSEPPAKVPAPPVPASVAPEKAPAQSSLAQVSTPGPASASTPPAHTQPDPVLAVLSNTVGDARVPAATPAQAPAPAPAQAPSSATALVSPVNLAASPPAPATPAAAQGSGFRDMLTNSIGMVLIWIAALPGTAHGGYVGKYEVSQSEFERVAGTNPSRFKAPSQPVENLTWQDASEFCRKLTQLEKAAGTLPDGFAYTLPTQAQWDLFLGDARFDDAVTSRSALRESPSPVGTMPPNKYGLCDVLGNVWEFCLDGGTPAERVLRGAAYSSRKLYAEKLAGWKPLEPGTPRHLPAAATAPDAGFRCVLTAPQL